ncbi:mitochondrial transcription rescue factor 1 isoform X2 [Protopterus annectens]|nr:mitochondrial transcription rescue factor 1 isoform X2 [Protopterus annectens]
MSCFRASIRVLRQFSVRTVCYENHQCHELCKIKNFTPACHHSNWTTIDCRHLNIHFPLKYCETFLLSLGKISYFPFRLKSSKSSQKGGKKSLQVKDEEDDDDSEKSDYEDELEEDPNLPKDYKDLEKVVQSLRFDLVMKAGLDMARNKVEDAFYDNKLRLNGEKLLKKSKQVKVGDALDLLIGDDKESDTITVMRVKVKKVSDEKTDTDKYRVVLRRWKNLKLPKKNLHMTKATDTD